MKIVCEFEQTFQLESSLINAVFKVAAGNARRGKVKFSISVADIHSYWHAFLPAPGDRIPWVLDVSFAAQRGMPFLTLMNIVGENKIAFGLTGCDLDSRFTARMNQETGCYDVTIEISSVEAIGDFGLWYDTACVPWQRTPDRWRDNLEGIFCEFPSSAWEPVFCTWYAVHGAVTQDWCERTAAKAADLGFRTFILDDGWCYADMKRVSPSTIGTWYEKIGDWKVDTVKFPDFKGHVKRVQAMGLKYLVWVAPYLIGDRSAMYEKLSAGGNVWGEYLEGYKKLAVENSEAAELLLDLMEELMADYELDGLKVDFLDQIYPDLEDPRAESCFAFSSELARRIRKHNPDAMIELRQSYCTPRMLSCGTQFRAGDAPFDFILNFRRIAQIRLAIGDSVPVHADPAYWPADELPVNISRHFIAMMAGVPMLSVELADLTPEAEAICRFWLSFYAKLKKYIKDAHWEFDYGCGALASAFATFGDCSLAIVADPCRVPEFKSDGYLLNLSGETIRYPGARVFDWKGDPLPGDEIPAGCGAAVKA